MVIYLIIHKLPSKSNYKFVKYNACITKIWKKETPSAKLIFKNSSIADIDKVLLQS